MHRVDTDGHASNLFTDGNAGTGVPATVVDAAILNAFQEELVNVVLAAGATLNKADRTQVVTALATLFGKLAVSNTWAAANTFNGGLAVGNGVSTNAIVAGVTSGTGNGIQATGGSGGGEGGRFANGVAATASARTDGVKIDNGDINLDGVANPNAGVAIKNRVTPKNIAKAWGIASFASGSISLADGFNVTSVAISSTLVQVNFAQAMASGTYVVLVQPISGPLMAGVFSRAAGSFQVQMYTGAGVAMDPASSSAGFMFAVFGVQ
jgi:hypothetical protein